MPEPNDRVPRHWLHWCILVLIKIAQDPDAFVLEELTPDPYAERRKQYIQTEPKNPFK